MKELTAVHTKNLLDNLNEEMRQKVLSTPLVQNPLILATKPYAKKIQDRLMLYSCFDIEQGCFIRTRITRGARKLGPMGCVDNDGYKRISVEGENFYQSKLIYLWITGCFPNDGELIDHIDGNRLNDRLENLRIIPCAYNHKNRKLACNNTSGYAGVTWRRSSCKWRSIIRPDGDTIYLGLFDTAKEAFLAREEYIQSHPELGFTARHGK